MQLVDQSVVVPPPLLFRSNCTRDASVPMQRWLDHLPPDTVVEPPPGACYLINGGLRLYKPQGLIIDGGTWRDATVPISTKSPAGQAIIWLVGGSGVTLENLTIEGVNPGGWYPPGAFQSGIRSDGVIALTVDNVNIDGPYGDGIELNALRGAQDDSGRIIRPTEDATINDVNIDQAGRTGISFGSVSGAIVTDVSLSHIGVNTFDLEADQSNEGVQNLTIDGCTADGAAAAFFANGGAGAAKFDSNITVENCTMEMMQGGFAIYMHEPLRFPYPKGPVTFANDTFICGHSVYVACVDVGGGVVTIWDSEITVPPGYDDEAVYSANDRTSLDFDDDTVTGYGQLGEIGPKSSVSIDGGTWTPYQG